jgi:hypothetical protein
MKQNSVMIVFRMIQIDKWRPKPHNAVRGLLLDLDDKECQGTMLHTLLNEYCTGCLRPLATVDCKYQCRKRFFGVGKMDPKTASMWKKAFPCDSIYKAC